MASRGASAHAVLTQAIGRPVTTGDWLEITQERIDRFADVTEDHQFLHVDPAACAAYSPGSVDASAPLRR